MIGASTGRGGTRRAQQQVRDALLFPGAVVLEEPEVAIPIAWERFDADGRLIDERSREMLAELIVALAGQLDLDGSAQDVPERTLIAH